MENILSALSPPHVSAASSASISLDNDNSKVFLPGNINVKSSIILESSDKVKPITSQFSSIFDLPTDDPAKNAQSNVNQTNSISSEHKKICLEKPESREKKTPSPKLKETWLLNQTPKQIELKKFETLTPLRIPKITIKDNFMNELPSKSKESKFSTCQLD